MWALLAKAAGWLLGKFFGSKEPSTADLSARAAAAETINEGQADASEELIAAAAARRDADTAAVLRDAARSAEVHPDPASPVNQDPDIHLRD